MFLSSANFFQNQLFQLKKTIRVSNSLDPAQARGFVRPDLDPNCLQRLSADDTSRHLVGKELTPCRKRPTQASRFVFNP